MVKIAYLILCIQVAFSQNDTLIIDFSGGFYSQQRLVHSEENSGQILYPDYLKYRRKYEPELRKRWELDTDRATDTPLGHGGSFIELNFKKKFNKTVSLFTSLVADNRGFSYGPYNKDQLIIYSKYLFSFNIQNKKQILFGEPITFKMNLGTFTNYKDFEGLTLYNIDFQAVVGSLHYKKFYIELMKIGDLMNSIGLSINDLDQIKLGVKNLNFIPNHQTDIALGLINYVNDWDEQKLDAVTISIGASNNKEDRFYGQIGYRVSNLTNNISLKLASLTGFTLRRYSKRSQLNFTFEHRYYGGIFNYKLNGETNVHFRNKKNDSFANYMGSNVYPLQNFERPFSQWAVYTEYHKSFLNSIILKFDYKYHYQTDAFIFFDLDVNTIFAANERPFTYPFLKVGIAYEVYKETYIMASITNKTMNLDKHYQTHYLVKYPGFMFNIIRTINWSSF